MTSKNSTYKVSLSGLMKNDLRRRAWMIAISTLANFIAFPVVFLFCCGQLIRGTLSTTTSAITLTYDTWYYLSDYFVSCHSIVQMIIIFLLAILLSVCGFYHLYSRKTADLYHSMPVTRDKSFLAYWLNGFLTWFVPFLSGDIIVYVMTLLLVGSSTPWANVTLLFLSQLALFTLCFLIIYNACLVAVMVSGNLSNALVNLFLYGLMVASAFAVIYGYMNSYYENFYYEANPVLESMIYGFTPFVSAVQLHVWFAEGTLLSQWGGALALSAVCMIFNFLLAMSLHRKRPSELAEKGLENKLFAIPFRFAGSCLSGLFLSLLFVGNGRGWCLFGALFGTVFIFAILNIAYHTSFKAIFCHKRQLGLAVLLTCGTVLFFAFDLSGYDAYLPDKKDITGFSLQVNTLRDEGYYMLKTEAGNYTHVLRNAIPDEPMFDNREEIYRLLQAMTTHQNHEKTNAAYCVTVRVYTKRGEYVRSYELDMNEENREAIRPFLESENFQAYFYPLSTGQMEPPAEIRVTSLDNFSFTITDSSLVNAIYEAYGSDFKDDDPMDEHNRRFLFLNMIYGYPTDHDDHLHLLSMGIPPWYDNTLALLKGQYPWLCWTPDDLTFHSLQVYIPPLSLMVSPSDADDPTATFYGTQSSRSITIDDPETLKELQPKLLVSKVQLRDLGSKYVYIGTLDASAGNFERTYYGYMEYDAIPKDLKRMMGIAQ